MRPVHAAFALLLLAPLGAAAQGNPPADPTGEWLVAKRVARIKIIPCEGKFWGFLSWEAEPGIDSNNPDPAKRTLPTLGLPILLGMTPSEPNEWSGEIYNAQDGRKYSSSIKLLNPDLLKVQGCVLGILCGGENWTRAAPPTTAGVPPKSGAAAKSPKGASAPSADEALCLEVTARAGPPH